MISHKFKRDDKENRKHSKIFDTIIHSFGTNYGHKISAYVHKRPKSVELPLNFFLVFALIRCGPAKTHSTYVRRLRHLVFSFCKFHCDAFRSVLNFRFCWPLFYLFSLVWFSLVHFTTYFVDVVPFDATKHTSTIELSYISFDCANFQWPSTSLFAHSHLHIFRDTNAALLCFVYYLHNSLCWLYKP